MYPQRRMGSATTAYRAPNLGAVKSTVQHTLGGNMNIGDGQTTVVASTADCPARTTKRFAVSCARAMNRCGDAPDARWRANHGRGPFRRRPVQQRFSAALFDELHDKRRTGNLGQQPATPRHPALRPVRTTRTECYRRGGVGRTRGTVLSRISARISTFSAKRSDHAGHVR